jgi:hypothetical protein
MAKDSRDESFEKLDTWWMKNSKSGQNFERELEDMGVVVEDQDDRR